MAPVAACAWTDVTTRKTLASPRATRAAVSSSLVGGRCMIKGSGASGALGLEGENLLRVHEHRASAARRRLEAPFQHRRERRGAEQRMVGRKGARDAGPAGFIDEKLN